VEDDDIVGLQHLETSDQRRYGKVLLTFHRLVGEAGPPR
jgi:hypothetical protein